MNPTSAEESKLTKNQVRVFGPKPFTYYGRQALITAEVRFDDQCNNGHNTFSITGNIRIPGKRDIEAGGCIHEEITKAFPELVPLIKWHLTSTEGPMHYLSNTMYHASDRDCYGLRAGESRHIRNGKTGLPTWELIAVDEDGNPCAPLPNYIDSPEQPMATVTMAYVPLCRIGQGKPRDLDAARACAVWPEATDEELMAPDLRERLEARLPALMAEFRAAMEGFGFEW